MNLKLDNKCEDREDITLLSEIITNYRYWPKHEFRVLSNYRLILEYIIKY